MRMKKLILIIFAFVILIGAGAFLQFQRHELFEAEASNGYVVKVSYRGSLFFGYLMTAEVTGPNAFRCLVFLGAYDLPTDYERHRVRVDPRAITISSRKTAAIVSISTDNSAR
jgi:hypothetical protein